MENLILTIDCGTQSLRLMIFDKKGHLLAIQQEKYEPYYSDVIGKCEKNPRDYFDAFITGAKKLSSNPYYKDITSIIVTTIRDTGVFLDKDGKVLRNSIHFLDTREAKNVSDIPMKFALPSKLVGMYDPIMTNKRQSTTNWVRENQPEIWEKTEHYLLLSGYFNYMLTGKYIDSKSNQIGHIPINFKTGTWDKKGGLFYDLFPIEPEKLPEIVPTGNIIGTLKKEIAEEIGLSKDIKVIAGSSDKACETLGTGCIDPSGMSISFGTAATIQTTTKNYIEPVPFLPSYPASIPGRFNPEINIYRGYWMISWFKREFSSEEIAQAKKLGISPEEILNERISEIPAGSEGLLLQPYWKPELKNPDARGAILGFTDGHNKYHIYRAIIEGINFALLEGMKKIEKKTKIKAEKIYVSGGGAKSDVICQITADMFNTKVVRGETSENSGLGSAIIAAVALGEYPTYEEAVKNMVRAKKEFIPNPENVEIYSKIFNNTYRKIYAKLKPIYKSIRKNLG